MSFVVACSTAELTDDLPLAVEVNGVELAIVAHQGDYFAIWNECSHGHVALSEGDVVGGTIECYLHGSQFDLRTGAALCLPATQPVPVYPVRIEGTDVLVDLDAPLPTD